MKKSAILFSLLFIAIFGFSQARFAVQLGTVLAGGTEEYNDPANRIDNYSVDINAQPGILVGAAAELPIITDWVFRPEINASYKNAKYSELGYTLKYHTFYLDIPMPVVYKFRTASGAAYIGGGPNLGIGLWGEAKDNLGNSVDIKFDGEANPTDDNFHYNAVNFGLGLTGGFEFSRGIYVSAAYVFGVSNLSPYEYTTSRSNEFNFKLGYVLGSGKSGSNSPRNEKL